MKGSYCAERGVLCTGEQSLISGAAVMDLGEKVEVSSLFVGKQIRLLSIQEDHHRRRRNLHPINRLSLIHLPNPTRCQVAALSFMHKVNSGLRHSHVTNKRYPHGLQAVEVSGEEQVDMIEFASRAEADDELLDAAHLACYVSIT